MSFFARPLPKPKQQQQQQQQQPPPPSSASAPQAAARRPSSASAFSFSPLFPQPKRQPQAAGRGRGHPKHSERSLAPPLQLPTPLFTPALPKVSSRSSSKPVVFKLADDAAAFKQNTKSRKPPFPSRFQRTQRTAEQVGQINRRGSKAQMDVPSKTLNALRAQNTTVFVSGLAFFDITPIRAAFGACGTVTNVEEATSSSSSTSGAENGKNALVTFADKQSAIRSLRISNVIGISTVKVSWARISKEEIARANAAAAAASSKAASTGFKVEELHDDADVGFVDAEPDTALDVDVDVDDDDDELPAVRVEELDGDEEEENEDEFDDEQELEEEEYVESMEDLGEGSSGESGEFSEGDAASVSEEELDPIPEPAALPRFTRQRTIPAAGAKTTGQLPQRSLANTQRIVGRCDRMCSVKNARARETTHKVSVFEIAPGSDVKDQSIDLNLAVKRYRDKGEDFGGMEDVDAGEVRTPAALQTTLDHLIRRSGPPVPILEREDHGFVEVYRFLSDTLRAVRQDCTYQGLTDDFVVRAHEENARFYLLSSFLLWEQPEVEAMTFQLTEQLNKCLISLRELYQDRSRPASPAYKLFPTEAEFQAYFLLTHLNDPEFGYYLKQVPPRIASSARIRLAVRAHRASRNNLYTQFTKIMLEEADFLSGCAMYISVTRMRMNAIRVINTLQGDVLFEELQRWLGFEDDDEIELFLKYAGLSNALGLAADGRQVLHCKQGRVEKSDTPLTPRRNSMLGRKFAKITAGMNLPLRAVVVGGTPLADDSSAAASTAAAEEQLRPHQEQYRAPAARARIERERKLELDAEQAQRNAAAAAAAEQDATRHRVAAEQQAEAERAAADELAAAAQQATAARASEKEHLAAERRKQLEAQQQHVALVARARAREQETADRAAAALRLQELEQRRESRRSTKRQQAVLRFRFHQWRTHALVHKVERAHFVKTQRLSRFAASQAAREEAVLWQQSPVASVAGPAELLSAIRGAGGSVVSPTTLKDYAALRDQDTGGSDFAWIRTVKHVPLARCVAEELQRISSVSQSRVEGHSSELKWKVCFFFGDRSPRDGVRGVPALSRALPIWVGSKFTKHCTELREGMELSTNTMPDRSTVTCALQIMFPSTGRHLRARLRGCGGLCYVLSWNDVVPPPRSFWRGHKQQLRNIEAALRGKRAPLTELDKQIWETQRIPLSLLFVTRHVLDSEFRHQVAKDARRHLLRPSDETANNAPVFGLCAISITQLPVEASRSNELRGSSDVLTRSAQWLARHAPAPPSLACQAPSTVIAARLGLVTEQLFQAAAAEDRQSVADQFRFHFHDFFDSITHGRQHISYRDPQSFVRAFNLVLKYAKRELAGHHLSLLDWPIPEIACFEAEQYGASNDNYNTIRFIDSSDEEALDRDFARNVDVDEFDDELVDLEFVPDARPPANRTWNSRSRRLDLKGILDRLRLPDLDIPQLVRNAIASLGNNIPLEPWDVVDRCVRDYIVACACDGDVERQVGELLVDTSEEDNVGGLDLANRCEYLLTHSIPWFALFELLFQSRLEDLQRAQRKSRRFRVVWFVPLDTVMLPGNSRFGNAASDSLLHGSIDDSISEGSEFPTTDHPSLRHSSDFQSRKRSRYAEESQLEPVDNNIPPAVIDLQHQPEVKKTRSISIKGDALLDAWLDGEPANAFAIEQERSWPNSSASLDDILRDTYETNHKISALLQ